MLILSRRAGEAIRIGGGIRLVVIATDHGGVRIGIEAPSDVSILREELVLEVESENLRARAEHPRSLKHLMSGVADEVDESAAPTPPAGADPNPPAGADPNPKGDGDPNS